MVFMTTSTFVGYERSPFSIAKYSVIAEMLQQTDATSRHILQVWFSSTWTHDTLLSFRQAGHAVLPRLKDKLDVKSTIDDNPPKRTADDQARAKIIQCVSDWIRTIPIQGDLATRYWFLYTCDAESSDRLLEACNFVSTADRASLLRYFLTGHVLGSNPSDNTTTDSGTTPGCSSRTPPDLVGNVTLWGGSNQKHAKEDPIISGDRITTKELTESLLDEKEQCSGKKDVIQCSIDRKMHQISKLKNLVSKGLVDIDLRFGDLGPLETPGIDSRNSVMECQDHVVVQSSGLFSSARLSRPCV